MKQKKAAAAIQRSATRILANRRKLRDMVDA
jgi:hypothetical protein